jgi:galactoside O-acetyltransferase
MNIGKNVKFIYPAFVMAGEVESIKVGHHSKLNCFLVTEGAGRIRIGEHCFIGKNTSIRSADSVEIGNHVLISAEILILDNNSHSLDYLERRTDVANNRPGYLHAAKSKIVIGDDVWISVIIQ